MSCSVRFNTVIQDAAMLSKACDRMRAADIAVKGPTERGTSRLVNLPGWHGPIEFHCNRDGTVYYDSDIVGPQEHLNRLTQEYSAAIAEREVQSVGGYVSHTEFDRTTGLLRVRLEVPEMVGTSG